MTASFGTIVRSRDVEKACEATLKRWTDVYLREMERIAGFPNQAYPSVRSWRAADTIDERFAEQQIPAVQIMFSSDIEVHSGGTYAAALFKGVIDVLVQGPTPEDARESASDYALMLALVLSQHKGLDGSIPVAGLAVERFGTPATARPSDRWLSLGSVELTIEIDRLWEELKGPVVGVFPPGGGEEGPVPESWETGAEVPPVPGTVSTTSLEVIEEVVTP